VPTYDRLRLVLLQGMRIGLIGGSDVEQHLVQAERFLDEVPPEAMTVVDLGSGGGLPGLVIAVRCHACRVLLVDRRQKATDFLRRAVTALELGERCQVVERDAAELGRDPAYREHADVVTARSVDAPGVTVELASALVRVGGVILVSEQPDGGRGRWPEQGLLAVGLRRRHGGAVTRLEKVAPLSERYPRRGRHRPVF
jgi:16S rRNA (guanine527-N7)-methyltransferase